MISEETRVASALNTLDLFLTFNVPITAGSAIELSGLAGMGSPGGIDTPLYVAGEDAKFVRDARFSCECSHICF